MLDSIFKAPLYIVIPVFNGWVQTRQCLKHLEESSFQDFKTILVDHGSTDDTKSGIKDFPEVVHLTESDALWWAGATNVGVKHALKSGATHIMLLNNDCYLGSNTLENLVSHLISMHSQKHSASIIAPLQRIYPNGDYFPKNVMSSFSLGYPTLSLPSLFSSRIEKSGLKKVKLIVGGRGSIIPSVVFRNIGLFDEKNLPHYGADHDFYLRCKSYNIPLLLANDSEVQIDQTRTTTSSDIGALNLRQFLHTFTSIRSHRNIRDLAALFKKHYPLKSLYSIGVALNVLRYTLVYGVKRTLYHLKFLSRRN